MSGRQEREELARKCEDALFSTCDTPDFNALAEFTIDWKKTILDKTIMSLMVIQPEVEQEIRADERRNTIRELLDTGEFPCPNDENCCHMCADCNHMIAQLNEKKVDNG